MITTSGKMSFVNKNGETIQIEKGWTERDMEHGYVEIDTIDNNGDGRTVRVPQRLFKQMHDDAMIEMARRVWNKAK